MMCVGNRDPRVFADPNRFDIRRDDAKKNFTFGYGIHFCIGAPLARLEAEIAFPLLLQRYPGLELAEDDPPWSGQHSHPRHAAHDSAGVGPSFDTPPAAATQDEGEMRRRDLLPHPEQAPAGGRIEGRFNKRISPNSRRAG